MGQGLQKYLFLRGQNKDEYVMYFIVATLLLSQRGRLVQKEGVKYQMREGWQLWYFVIYL